jgi:HK97 family phage prohead protease
MARSILTRAEAGAERALKYRDETARPRERSAPEQSGAPRLWTPASRSACSVERAAAGSASPGTARFEGFASVTDTPYTMFDYLGEYEEVVALGAFEQTLAQSDLDVPLVLDHTSSRRLARSGNASSPLELTEITDGETTGLQSIAPTMQLSDPDVAYIVPKLESGLIDEMSFRFMILAGRWSDDFTTYTIQRVDIHRGDVAIVGYGANPHTVGAGLRAAPDDAAVKRARDRALAVSAAGDNRYARLSA